MALDSNLKRLEITTPNGEVSFNSITNDEDSFFLLRTCAEKGNSVIYKYDECFKFLSKKIVNYKLTSIYFDRSERMFYVSIRGINDKIFKLNDNYNIVGEIAFKNEECFNGFGEILGISKNCCKNYYVITYSRYIISYDINGQIKIINESICNRKYLFNNSIPPYNCFAYSKYSNYYFAISCGDKNYIKISLPSVGVPKAMTSTICMKKKIIKFFILYSLNGRSYILNYNVRLNRLKRALDCCNLLLLSNRFSEGRNLGKYDIDQSIKQIEDALSNILRVEGERIQEFLEISDDHREIHKLKESVLDKINSVKEIQEILNVKIKNNYDSY